MQLEAQLAEAHRRLEAGDRGGAAACYMEALRRQPDSAEALLGLGGLHLEAGRHGHGRELVLRALEAPMRSPREALLLASSLHAIGESGLLRAVASQIPLSAWGSASQLVEFARSLAASGLHREADACLDEALRREPDLPTANFLKAEQDIAFGRFESASQHLDRVLAVLPDDPGSHWLRSRLRLPEPEGRIPCLRALLARAGDTAARAWLGHALHNELHELGAYDEAWEALQLGAAAQRQRVHYDLEASRALTAALLRVSAAELKPEDGHHDRRLRPVFIVGHYRSGTTLVERLLGGHPAIATAGESFGFPTVLRRESGLHFRGESHEHAVLTRERHDHGRMGRGYLELVRWQAGERPFVTDKLPGNVHNLGAIARALPGALIVHVHRDPLAVGLSNFRTLFGQACPYSYDLREFAEYHRRQALLMAHWREVLPPGRLVEIDYATLVRDPRSALAPVMAALGLDFDPAMLDLGRKGDAVATASAVLVRDGLRRDRDGLVAAYAAKLGPLAEALGLPLPGA